jgi:hypothetical protein
MFFLNSSPSLRFNSILNLEGMKGISFLPTFTDYYDYDFRNIQAYELLEDLF